MLVPKLKFSTKKFQSNSFTLLQNLQVNTMNQFQYNTYAANHENNNCGTKTEENNAKLCSVNINITISYLRLAMNTSFAAPSSEGYEIITRTFIYIRFSPCFHHFSSDLGFKSLVQSAKSDATHSKADDDPNPFTYHSSQVCRRWTKLE